MKNKAIITNTKFKKYLNQADFTVLTSDNLSSVIVAQYDIAYVILPKEEQRELKKRYLPLGMHVCFIEVNEADLNRAYFNNNYTKISEELLNIRKWTTIHLDDSILSNTQIAQHDKYVYSIVKAYLTYNNRPEFGRKSGDLWVNIDELIAWAKTHFKSSDVKKYINDFLKSSFVAIDKSDRKTPRFKLKSTAEIIGEKTTLYVDLVLARDERFSLKTFIKLGVEFLYAKPIAVDRTSGIDYISEIASAPASKRKKLLAKHMVNLVGCTNQAHIAKLMGISQARVSQICKDFLKVYTFREINQKEFEDSNFEHMNERGHKNPLLRKYSLESEIKLETGEITYETKYYALMGTKLISHFQFKSSIYAITKQKVKTRTGETIEIEKAVRTVFNHLVSSLKYKSRLSKSDSNSDVDLETKADIQFHADKNEVNKRTVNILQIIARNNRTAFDKLTSFTLKKLMLDLIQSARLGTLDRRLKSLGLSRKQIGYEINKINKQLHNEYLDEKKRAQLQVISSAYNRIKNLLKAVDARIANQSNFVWPTDDINTVDTLLELQNDNLDVVINEDELEYDIDLEELLDGEAPF